MQTLEPLEKLPHRAFTDLHHSVGDFQTLRFMVTYLFQLLGEQAAVPDWPASFVRYFPSETEWVYRIVVTQPAILATLRPVTVVGFFGQRRPGADLPLAQRLDHELLPELFRHDELLCYTSLGLPSSNFANLVLFRSAMGKDAWGKSSLHAQAVRMLTPEFYANVRLYNGRLAEGIMNVTTLKLDVVKYFDYHSDPVWRAERPLPAEVSAWTVQ